MTAPHARLLLLSLTLPVFTAAATDIGHITLFGQEYRVQRFDYSQDVRWPDPLDPRFNLNLIECEGAHWLGNDRLLLSTDGLDSLLSLKNAVVEVRLRRDTDGEIQGLEYVRTVVVNDPFDSAYGGFDLSPCGVTINTSAVGLAANGDLLVGDSEANGVRGYRRSDGFDLGGFSGGLANNSFDDLAFAPSNGLIYTINEDFYRLVTFRPTGEFVASTPIPGMTALNPLWIPGSPKGMAYLPDADTVPASIRRPGGVMLITLDDNNPGLQVYDLAGNVIATEPLSDNPAVGGNSLLDQGADCGNPLQLEAAAFDPVTGTIFLINEGSFFDCSGFFVLTPVGSCGCPADYNGDGGVDGSDVEAFFTQWEASEGCSDVNQDGGVDGGDVEAFFNRWEAGGCD
ncbi:MAG: hypothetical protein JNK25_01100 [Phycisphaerae bacterium]|nr:hypothetical protein [Phycisphaerae bacterium]